MVENKEHKLLRQITEFIKQSSLTAGDKLPSEREMAEKFGASRNTLRSAIRTIAASGAVEVRHQSGIYLVSKSALDNISNIGSEQDDNKRISEQLEAFFLFEPTAVVLATQRMGDDEIEKLEKCVVKMSNAFLENDVDRIVASHRRFHQIIAAGSHNQSIITMLERLDITYVFVSNVVSKISQDERNKIFARHVNLYKAIRGRDIEAARKMSLQMILSTSLLLNKFEGIELPKMIDKEIGNQILDMKMQLARKNNA